MSLNGNFPLDCASPENLVINTSKRFQKSVMDRVVTRGDAFVAAQEVGFDNLCDIADGRPCGIDTLMNQSPTRNGFPLSTNPENYSASAAVLEDPCPDKGENMKQYVSRFQSSSELHEPDALCFASMHS